MPAHIEKSVSIVRVRKHWEDIIQEDPKKRISIDIVEFEAAAGEGGPVKLFDVTVYSEERGSWPFVGTQEDVMKILKGVEIGFNLSGIPISIPTNPESLHYHDVKEFNDLLT
jgi:hypothetical protein